MLTSATQWVCMPLERLYWAFFVSGGGSYNNATKTTRFINWTCAGQVVNVSVPQLSNPQLDYDAYAKKILTALHQKNGRNHTDALGSHG